MSCQTYLTLAALILRYCGTGPQGLCGARWCLCRALSASCRERTHRRTGRILYALRMIPLIVEARS